MGKRRRFKRKKYQQLETFVSDHEGVEGYIEPRTPTMDESILLVSSSGEWLREAVPRGNAADICRKMGIPVYDAAVVGYPDRLRGLSSKPAPKAPSAEELEKWFQQDAGKGEAPPQESE